MNRHFLDVVRTLLIESFVPPKFWVEALTTTTFLINRLLSQVLDYESLYFRFYRGHFPYTNLHIFGCVCFMHLPPTYRNKFLPNLFVVLSWGLMSHKKVIYAMIQISIGFMFQEMCYLLKINGSFLCLHHQAFHCVLAFF